MKRSPLFFVVPVIILFFYPVLNDAAAGQEEQKELAVQHPVVKSDRARTTDIWEAILLDKIDAVQYWLDQGIDIESRFLRVRNYTPLIDAASWGRVPIVQLYLIEVLI